MKIRQIQVLIMASHTTGKTILARVGGVGCLFYKPVCDFRDAKTRKEYIPTIPWNSKSDESVWNREENLIFMI